MSGRIRRCSSHRRVSLEDWQLAAAPPAARDAAPTAAPDALDWSRATVPGTAASSLRDSGGWSLDSAQRNFDATDWWYRCRFTAAPAAAGERVILGFDGLATLAQVWLNGAPLLLSDNMFIEHRCDVGALLAGQNELLVRFASLDVHLQAKRPRPRWRTPMVRQQQQSWARTTLLGRTPGWSPPAAAVGPWRPVWLERRRLLDIGNLRLQTRVADRSGHIAVRCEASALGGAVLESARLVAERAGRRHETALGIVPGAASLGGELRIDAAELWWPHTHGEPALYALRLEVVLADTQHGAQTVDVDLGHTGFRELHLDRNARDFALRVNGVPVFCRGACWMPLDAVGLQGSEDERIEALDQVRSAGMNMLRVAGSLVYESDQFLDLCDAGGILLWQDFMFANMDYPAGDAAFMDSVRLEARQQLARLQGRPSLAVVCGNSEAAQQAAMSGAGRECWAPPLFETDLKGLAQEACADVPYCPSSTHGGDFPHQPSCGVTSYYGVGAYMLPLTDARRSQVRFASECLAFANVPEAETLALLSDGGAVRCHHPRWKERVPRDLGAGWDFDDVREHYHRELFALDPAALRYADHDRYLRQARVISGEVMAASYGEWRRSRSLCRGALVLFLRDLWPGAGWGVIDSTGLPKAAYYHLKRALQPLALFVSDEGNNGLSLHVVNDQPVSVRARLELRLFRFSEPVGQPASRDIEVGPACAIELNATELFDGFIDLSYAYRFGPAPYDLLSAGLIREDGAILAHAFHLPLGLPNRVEGDVVLSASAAPLGQQRYQLSIQSNRFAQSVHVEMPGYVADDQYFHMAPKSTRMLEIRPRRSAGVTPPQAMVYALNAASPCRVVIGR
jgi:beta-mannosidase